MPLLRPHHLILKESFARWNAVIVQLSVAAEELNRHWFELNTSQIVKDRQRRAVASKSIAPVRASESAWLREGGHDAIHAAPAMTLDRSNGAWSACACREALEVPDITVGRIEQQEAGLRGHVAEVILVADPLRLLQNQRALVDAVRGCDTDDVWISEIRSLCFDCIAPSSTVVWMVAGSFGSATDFCSAARNAPLALFSRATLASPCSSGAAARPIRTARRLLAVVRATGRATDSVANGDPSGSPSCCDGAASGRSQLSSMPRSPLLISVVVGSARGRSSGCAEEQPSRLP